MIGNSQYPRRQTNHKVVCSQKNAGFILWETVVDLIVVILISFFLFETITVDQRQLNQLQATNQRLIEENNELKQTWAVQQPQTQFDPEDSE
ncbi:hypothetical protein ACFQHW_08305 [Lapidilactobacillus achengensis]|uniref:Cell division protein FtsL n=1 Tax=Lapidilactobacillus achengensis TaxID=2486000 RepID=A0ABW1UNM1_9LACO|nr:hypothetical protein [Lapidilactobacillus achengensis]